jgi:hypothetical protein
MLKEVFNKRDFNEKSCIKCLLGSSNIEKRSVQRRNKVAELWSLTFDYCFASYLFYATVRQYEMQIPPLGTNLPPMQPAAEKKVKWGEM